MISGLTKSYLVKSTTKLIIIVSKPPTKNDFISNYNIQNKTASKYSKRYSLHIIQKVTHFFTLLPSENVSSIKNIKISKESTNKIIFKTLCTVSKKYQTFPTAITTKLTAMVPISSKQISVYNIKNKILFEYLNKSSLNQIIRMTTLTSFVSSINLPSIKDINTLKKMIEICFNTTMTNMKKRTRISDYLNTTNLNINKKITTSFPIFSRNLSSIKDITISKKIIPEKSFKTTINNIMKTDRIFSLIIYSKIIFTSSFTKLYIFASPFNISSIKNIGLTQSYLSKYTTKFQKIPFKSSTKVSFISNYNIQNKTSPKYLNTSNLYMINIVTTFSTLVSYNISAIIDIKISKEMEIETPISNVKKTNQIFSTTFKTLKLISKYFYNSSILEIPLPTLNSSVSLSSKSDNVLKKTKNESFKTTMSSVKKTDRIFYGTIMSSKLIITSSLFYYFIKLSSKH